MYVVWLGQVQQGASFFRPASSLAWLIEDVGRANEIVSELRDWIIQDCFPRGLGNIYDRRYWDGTGYFNFVKNVYPKGFDRRLDDKHDAGYRFRAAVDHVVKRSQDAVVVNALAGFNRGQLLFRGVVITRDKDFRGRPDTKLIPQHGFFVPDDAVPDYPYFETAEILNI